jgi:hypothetical protein
MKSALDDCAVAVVDDVFFDDDPHAASASGSRARAAYLRTARA